MAKKRDFGKMSEKVLRGDKPENVPVSLEDFIQGTDGKDVKASKSQNAKTSKPQDVGKPGSRDSQNVKTLKPQDVEKPGGRDTEKSEPQNVKTSKSQNAKTLDQRLTVYLSEEGLNSLEEVWFKLRKMASAGDRKRISKSLILEEAFLIALDDLESKGEKSRIASTVLKQ